MPARKKSAPRSESGVQIAKQGAKFGLVGVSNTAIDFTIYNLVSWLLNVMPDQLFLVKAMSGTVAMINSFYWNRRWTFNSKVGVAESGVKFLLTTLVSVYIIQPGMVYIFTATAGREFGEFWFNFAQTIGVIGLAPHTFTELFVVKNVAFAMGVLGSAVWNFTLYKLWAFKK
jgi:putative flippase GtrA